MSDGYGDVDVSLNVTQNEPQTVHEFTRRDHYPDEVAAQWGKIRAGRHVLVDEDGHEVQSLEDAAVVMHPSYGMAEMPSSLSGLGPDDLPPVTGTRVGRPDEVGDPEILEDDFRLHSFKWIDTETEHLMVSYENGIVDWNEREVIERFDDD